MGLFDRALAAVVIVLIFLCGFTGKRRHSLCICALRWRSRGLNLRQRLSGKTRIARKTITEWLGIYAAQGLAHCSFAQGHVIPLQRMSTQLSSVRMFQMFAIGTMFDSRQQLKTQRSQELELKRKKIISPVKIFWFEPMFVALHIRRAGVITHMR